MVYFWSFLPHFTHLFVTLSQQKKTCPRGRSFLLLVYTDLSLAQGESILRSNTLLPLFYQSFFLDGSSLQRVKPRTRRPPRICGAVMLSLRNRKLVTTATRGSM